MRLLAAQALRGRLPVAKVAQARKHLVGTGLATCLHLPVVLHQVALVTFVQAELAQKLRGQLDATEPTLLPLGSGGIEVVSGQAPASARRLRARRNWPYRP